MAGKRVWFITGAGRGMGVDIAQAALADGHAVVATGRNTEAVADAVGEADDLLVVELDITSLPSAEKAAQAALDRFGRIDVLVNNAGNFYAGFFEELTPEQIERSLTTNLVGPMNVTRAALPGMRKQRSGNVVTITSTAGVVGQEFCSAYAAAKFGVEGWMESLRFEVEPFGIHTTIVEPGFFRTELLEKESTAYADVSIDDYAERTAQTRPAWEAMSGKQGGDPAKLAKALVTSSKRSSRRCAGLQGRTRSRPSSRRPTSCSRRSMPTATYRRRSRSTRLKPDVRRSWPAPNAHVTFAHTRPSLTFHAGVGGPSGVHRDRIARCASLRQPGSLARPKTSSTCWPTCATTGSGTAGSAALNCGAPSPLGWARGSPSSTAARRTR
jgi:NAD(P)-dependent dehydrogenase (short-subunit alcohol dehydrogenase family)